jgi:YidC/Oxa1 family membrane protein insertase
MESYASTMLPPFHLSHSLSCARVVNNRVDGVPSLGWEDTTAFLILPVLLVVSQFISMELMSTKSDDPAQQQSNVILKVLPLLIGWFSLNVPAALCVYWFANNIITTTTSVIIKNSIKVDPVAAVSSAAAVTAPAVANFTPTREKPSGFADASPKVSGDEIKTITAVDAEIVESVSTKEATESKTEEATESKNTKKRGGKNKKKKKKN